MRPDLLRGKSKPNNTPDSAGEDDLYKADFVGLGIQRVDRITPHRLKLSQREGFGF